jgi:hypothetical protein
MEIPHLADGNARLARILNVGVAGRLSNVRGVDSRKRDLQTGNARRAADHAGM